MILCRGKRETHKTPALTDNMKLGKTNLSVINKMVNRGESDDQIVEHLLFIDLDDQIKSDTDKKTFTDLVREAILFTDMDAD